MRVLHAFRSDAPWAGPAQRSARLSQETPGASTSGRSHRLTRVSVSVRAALGRLGCELAGTVPTQGGVASSVPDV
jgi:hypothetical protein